MLFSFVYVDGEVRVSSGSVPLEHLCAFLNGTHQLLAYADDVNILGGSAHTVKENADALVVAAKEIGLEVNADKTKYMVILGIGMQGRVTV